jgi:hypothetical protein
MAVVAALRGLRSKGGGGGRNAGRKKQIANVRVETKGRGGVWRRQVRKSSRSLRRVPLSKAAPPLKPATTVWKLKGSLTPGPHLSPPMTGGPGPPVKSVVAGGGGGSGIRTASAAGWARIRQETEPSGAQNADGGRPLRDLARGICPSCPYTTGATRPPGATLGYGPTCGFVPHPRWAWGPLSVHTDKDTSCYGVQLWHVRQAHRDGRTPPHARPPFLDHRQGAAQRPEGRSSPL